MDNETAAITIPYGQRGDDMMTNMADGQRNMDAKSAQKAQDFYSFFRSGNHNEMQQHLVQLARNDTLDKADLALLALMLTNITDLPARSLLLRDEQCRNALQTILETVRQTEESHNSKPYAADVLEIERIISSPPPSPDVF
ncbi:uncharacterized protein [Amphiura filiformis]|uniref:uncharacterized protein n=1 Tax=Amphiura filiformis TaxID=82378 RepID=UPI003B227644